MQYVGQLKGAKRHGAALGFWLSVLVLTLALVTAASGAEPDWQFYDQALKEHVSAGMKNGTPLALVDYAVLAEKRSIEKVASQLEAFDVGRLSTREERLAFYINAYNVLAMKMVLDNAPLDSIKDAGSLFTSVWKKPAGRLGGRPMTLHALEHEILRPMGEPRIHLAIVCASVSCPDLRREAYTAFKLDEQLDDQTRQFLHNGVKGLVLGEDEARISKLFDWFESDFEDQGGVEAFVRRYRTDLSPSLHIKPSLSYDWALNGEG